jgi:phosphate transport system permease protein
VTTAYVDSELPPSIWGGPEDAPRTISERVGLSDRLFRGFARSGGLSVLVVMSVIGLFLAYNARRAIGNAKFSFLTTAGWTPDAGAGHFGIAAVLLGSIAIGLTAMTIALPLAMGTALYICEYAPRKLKRTLISIVDLMAAVPSVVFGLWGFFFLAPDFMVRGPQGEGLPRWISAYFGWIPIFKVNGIDPHSPTVKATQFVGSIFMAGVVVAFMVTPIACSIMREAFQQAPIGEREGALALGATKWGMIRTVVLPFGKGGIIGGTMLGLGRALGETIAVVMIISQQFHVQPHILESGASSVSALIASRFGEASPSPRLGISALMAAGLALFTLTLIVNFGASIVVARSRSGASSDA